MRLIDADELRSWLNGFIETDNISPTYMRTLIDTRTTIESIPVEWIEQHIKELDTELHSLYSRFYSQRDSKEKNEALLRSVKLRTTFRAYETVLREWRKENETN